MLQQIKIHLHYIYPISRLHFPAAHGDVFRFNKNINFHWSQKYLFLMFYITSASYITKCKNTHINTFKCGAQNCNLLYILTQSNDSKYVGKCTEFHSVLQCVCACVYRSVQQAYLRLSCSAVGETWSDLTGHSAPQHPPNQHPAATPGQTPLQHTADWLTRTPELGLPVPGSSHKPIDFSQSCCKDCGPAASGWLK